MVTLSDFNNVEKPTLAELSPVPQVAQVFNGATINNMAAHAALLSDPTSVPKTYSAIASELTNGTSSVTLDALLKQNKDTDQAANYDELQKVLRDPEIGNDVKQQYMDGYINSVSIPQNRSLSVLVGQKAREQQVSPDENDETLATTVGDVPIEDNVDAYRGWVQNAINTQTALKDRDGVNLFLDVVESLVPFMDQAAVAKSKLASGGNVGDMFKSLTLLGDSKADMRNAISKMPVEDRYAFAQKLIDVVKNTGGSFTIRPNELSVVNQLNSYLVSGAYVDSDQFLDNLFSVTDIVFPVSGWIGKAFKGAKAATEAAAISERAAKAEARLGSVAANVVDEGSGSLVTSDRLPQSENVLENPLILKGKTFSETSPLTPKGELAPVANPIIRDLNLTPKGGRRATTEFEGGFVGPEKPVMDQIDDVMNESVVNRLSTRTTVDHMSVSQTFKDANPGKARQVNILVEADKTDDAARILTGTTRKEAIANDRLGEVSAPNGVVRNKVEMDEAGPKPDEAVVNSIIQDRGRIDLDKKEKILMREKVKDAFRDVIGLVPRKAMATIGREVDEAVDTPRGVAFDTIYGPKDGGFVSAPQAAKQVMVGLSKYGVTPDEVEILAKQANGLYAPVKGMPTKQGNYLVRVKHDYEFSPGDVVAHSTLGNSKYTMFDSRVSITDGNAGALYQHAIPVTSIINRVILNSASAASDKSALIGKKLLQLAEQYGSKYKKLPPRQKALVDLYRIEANEKGIAFSVTNLRARGFDEGAIDTMRSWKTITDTMWALENRDFNKTLRLRGWERFVDQTNDTDLIVKSVPNSGFGNGVRAYDPEQNVIRNFTKQEIDELYAKGGNVADTKTVVELGDDTFTKVIVKQNAEGSYTRRIRDKDITLPYRDGYYPVKYDAPIFITKKFKAPDGTSYTKAIATAGNHNDAAQLLERLRTTDGELDDAGESVYRARPDYRRGTQEFEDAEWSAAVSGGRSSQRIRGERLADASRQTDLAHVHIESPEESLISSIRSLAARTAFRDWTETTKARWLSQNADLLEKVDGFKTLWPSDVNAIGRGNVEASNMRIKDAKATWRYVHAMEAGYANLLDDMIKNFFRNMSTTVGKQSWGWLDKTGAKTFIEKSTDKLSQTSPSGFARKKAFRFMLAANPTRQLPVQAMQALPVLLATNPLAIPKISVQMILLNYLKRGGDADSFMKVMAEKASGMTTKEAKQLAKDWEASGFEAAVDANTLIRDDMAHLVDRTTWQKVSGVLRKPLDFTQKIGFNTGESLLMRSVWLSEYDLAKKAGKTLDAEGLEELSARVRNLTLNMNKAGELPYNQNVLSAAFQFFQAPHKAFAQILLGHTGLSTADRIKLGTSYILTYGIGGGYLTDMIWDGVSSLSGNVDPETKELIEGGLFNLAMNNALSTLYGEQVALDFSDSLRLLPISEALNLEFFTSILGSEVGETLSNSASASLVFGSNPRLTNFVKQMMRPFVVDWDKKPEELFLAGKSFLTIFSGMSNYFKAQYALEYQKSITAKGRVVDYHVNDIEALAKIAGFNTIDEIQSYASDEELYKKSGKYKDDIKLLIDETSSRLAAKGVSNEEAGWYMDMMAEAQRVYKNDPFYMEEFANQIKYKATAGEYSLYNRLKEMSGWMNADEYEKFVTSFPNLPDDAKKVLIDAKKMFGAK